MKIVAAPGIHFNDRPAGIMVCAVVIHDTGGHTAAGTLAWYQNPDSKVSSHYLIDRDGTVYAVVPEEKRAWHAGIGSLFGRDDVNSWSVGIELVDDDDRDRYPRVQIGAAAELTAEICKRYSIPLHRVVGHQHIAPGRKIDPGLDFDWWTFLLAVAHLIYP